MYRFEMPSISLHLAILNGAFFNQVHMTWQCKFVGLEAFWNSSRTYHPFFAQLERSGFLASSLPRRIAFNLLTSRNGQSFVWIDVTVVMVIECYWHETDSQFFCFKHVFFRSALTFFFQFQNEEASQGWCDDKAMCSGNVPRLGGFQNPH